MTAISIVVLLGTAVGMVASSVAFADHSKATVHNPVGSSVPGCEETDEGCFIPSTVTIDVGGEVTWMNDDAAAHTVTSGVLVDGGPDGVFDSGLFSPATSFSHKFEDVGEYPYFCLVHPWMEGLVIVQEVTTTIEPLVVEVDRDVYHYGDTLSIAIIVEEITEPFATMYIRDSDGKTSSPINVPLHQPYTQLPPAAPFDRTVYSEGTYTVDVEYAGLAATTSFDLVDVGTLVIPNWIKEVAFLWVSGEISGANYVDVLGSLVAEGLLVPGDDAEPSLPAWLVAPTAWWLGGLITDEAYVTMLQYLVDRGIVTGLEG